MVVSLIPEAPKGGVSLVPEEKVQLDDEVIRSRISKADYAMGDESPGQGALAADFWSGFERRVREQAALSEATRMRKEWMQASSDIAKAAAMEGRPLTDLEMSYILDRPVEEVSADSALEK